MTKVLRMPLYTLAAGLLAMSEASCATQAASSPSPASCVPSCEASEDGFGTTSSLADERFGEDDEAGLLAACSADVAEYPSPEFWNPLWRALEVPVRAMPGEPVVFGGLSENVIREVWRMHQNEIENCYRKALLESPDLQGQIEMKVVIDAAGDVTEAIAAGAMIGSDGVVGKCVERRIHHWKFPQPAGGGLVVVHYPWTFEPIQFDPPVTLPADRTEGNALR